jgi:putative copper resistance protein D
LKYVRTGQAEIVQRYSYLATWAVAALVGSGIAATYSRIDSVSDLWSSGFGKLVVLKVIVFGLAGYFAIQARRAIAASQSAAKFGAFEISFLSLAVGLGVALHSTPLSRGGAKLPSAAEEILGFEFPPVPSFTTVVLGWHPEWLMLTGALLAAGLYVVGVSRLRSNDIAWSTLRTASFLTGISIVIWSTCAGISKYAMVSFAAHMVSHMSLSMLAPIFLVMGMPITLALRALPAHHDESHRNARSWVLSLLHSKYGTFISHPLFVLTLFTFGLYGMYFTSLFGTLMASHAGHLFMEVHFLLTGCLFAFLVIGLDPAPRNVPHLVRLVLVLIAISLHAFFAIALMQSATPIGNEWYSLVRPPWIENPLNDTYTGGGVAWAVGEIPSLLLMVIVAVQWARSEDRVAQRVDRQADRDGDRELSEYNERLARMNKTES